MLSLVGWLILFVMYWPMALLALVLWPLVWLFLIPLKLIGMGVGAVLALIKSILFLPATLLGYPGTK